MLQEHLQKELIQKYIHIKYYADLILRHPIYFICTLSSLISSTLNNIFDTIYIVHTPLQIVMTLLSFKSKYFGYDVIRM